MSFMQVVGSWRVYLIVLLPFTLVSLVVSFNLQLVYAAFSWINRKIRIMRRRGNDLYQLEAGLHVGYNKIE